NARRGGGIHSRSWETPGAKEEREGGKAASVEPHDNGGTRLHRGAVGLGCAKVPTALGGGEGARTGRRIADEHPAVNDFPVRIDVDQELHFALGRGLQRSGGQPAICTGTQLEIRIEETLPHFLAGLEWVGPLLAGH